MFTVLIWRREGEKSMPRLTLQELVKVELTRIRGIAEEANNDALLYFIDMAISEVQTNFHYRNDKGEVYTLRRKRLVRQAS